jgi:hypothetical protein
MAEIFLYEQRMRGTHSLVRPGVVEKSYDLAPGFAKVTGAPGAVKDKFAARIDAWVENPGRPPATDKSHIAGFGSS